MFKTEILPIQPNGRGSIGGHAVRCSCGMSWSTSLGEHQAAREASEHLAWHARGKRPR